MPNYFDWFLLLVRIGPCPDFHDLDEGSRSSSCTHTQRFKVQHLAGSVWIVIPCVHFLAFVSAASDIAPFFGPLLFREVPLQSINIAVASTYPNLLIYR